jgi:hypothetical protein
VTRFAKSLPDRERRAAVRPARGERGIWQQRFWEHLIRDDADYERHVAYCYINPVKHGLVARVQDWPHSSFHRYVRRGLFPLDWGGGRRSRNEGRIWRMRVSRCIRRRVEGGLARLLPRVIRRLKTQWRVKENPPYAVHNPPGGPRNGGLKRTRPTL